MSRFTHDVVVIGGGSGGLIAAYGCAQLGMKTALVERAKLGGDCLHVGCVPSKTLLRTAAIRHLSSQSREFGLPQIELPPVDMAAVNRRVAEVIAQIQVHDSPERYERLGVEVIAASARFLSPYEVQLEGAGTTVTRPDATTGGTRTARVVSAPRIVVATGSSPRSIPIPGLDEAGYITNLDAFSLSELPRRLVVIGAGPIGVELGQAFARLGSSVTLLDAAPEILPLEDGDMAAVVRDLLERDGVAVRTNITVPRVETANGAKRVVVGGAAEEVIEADEILLAVGRTGNTADLGLSQAGVAVEDSFIVSDSRLRTTQKHVLAVGDVNGRFLFTHVAGAEGSLAVRRIALHAGGAMDYRRVPWCTYSDPELASIGYNEKRAEEEGIAFSVISEPLSGNDRARTDNATEGRIKMLVDRSGRVIGTQIVGSHAGDLLAPALFSVGSRWKAGNLMGPIYPYPTFAEIHRRAVSSHMAGRLFNDRVRRFLRFLFRYRGSAGIDPRGDEHGE